MKSGLRIVCIVLLLLASVTGLAFAAVEPVTLKLDGNIVETEVPPTIMSGRTMVPAKFLFEEMGGTVDWLEQTRQVRITLEDTEVLLTIDSTTALVNGSPVVMDIAPTIVSRRTLIPVALVAEQLGFGVKWINETRTVEITTPEQPDRPKIISIEVEEMDEDTYRVIVAADRELNGYHGSFYESPDRYVLDIDKADLQFGIDEAAEGVTEGYITAGNPVFDAVRFSQFNEDTVRVVADLNGQAQGESSLSADKTAIYIDLKLKDEPSDGDGGEDGNQSSVDPGVLNGTGVPLLDERLRDKLIVIDPGHGGTDPGSLGKAADGTVIQMEKDLNLEIALRLTELLRGAGANVYMLRTDDSSMALYDRPAKANELQADLYVSVHNNSNESATPSGTETHYYNKTMEKDYGYTSKDIADAVQKELVSAVGLKDRGVKSSPALAVLNRSNMPAIIIEGGFLSNPTELAFMMTDQFKEAYATGAAKGIITALNASVNGY